VEGRPGDGGERSTQKYRWTIMRGMNVGDSGLRTWSLEDGSHDKLTTRQGFAGAFQAACKAGLKVDGATMADHRGRQRTTLLQSTEGAVQHAPLKAQGSRLKPRQTPCLRVSKILQVSRRTRRAHYYRGQSTHQVILSVCRATSSRSHSPTAVIDFSQC
jgi:hypothetical protein